MMLLACRQWFPVLPVARPMLPVLWQSFPALPVARLLLPVLWQSFPALLVARLMRPAIWQTFPAVLVPTTMRSPLVTFMPKFGVNFEVAASKPLLMPCERVARLVVSSKLGSLWMKWWAATPWFVPFPSSSTRDKPQAPTSPTPALIHQGAVLAQLTELGCFVCVCVCVC